VELRSKQLDGEKRHNQNTTKIVVQYRSRNYLQNRMN